MKESRKKIILTALLTLFSFSVFGIVFVNATLYSPNGEIEIAKEPALRYPVRLSIPSLGINAKVQRVGITKKGNMAAPSNFADVGWYKYGTIPGGRGSAVIAGHVDNGLALPGVFKNLENIKNGDDIYITTTQKNNPIHFVVKNIAIYSFDSPTGNIFNNKDGSLIQLVTCTGTWVPQYGTHDKRLVVTAERYYQ